MKSNNQPNAYDFPLKALVITSAFEYALDLIGLFWGLGSSERVKFAGNNKDYVWKK